MDQYLGSIKIKEFLIKKMMNEKFRVEDLLEAPIVCPKMQKLKTS
jgi:hypothetical protein